MTAATLPPVAPAVTAEIVDALTPRLRKRLDAAVAKLAARPVTRDGDDVSIAVDDETVLVLHAPGGAVTSADDVRCGCLLAPACVHRAAAASAAPVAEDMEPVDTAPVDTAPADTVEPPATGPGTAGQDAPAGQAPLAGPAGPAGPGGPDQAGNREVTDASRATGGNSTSAAAHLPEPAARALWAAGAAALDAGITGGGAVLQAELLRAAHAARLAGLHRPAAAAVSVATGLRAARAADPDHRLGDLVDALTDLLDTAHRLCTPGAAGDGDPRGRARQVYEPAGALRVHGLFTEPVVTTGGHGGITTLVVDSSGALRTISDIAPGGAERAVGAAGRSVRLGGTAVDARTLGRTGLVVSGATVSPTGRLGGGTSARAVRAPGTAWTGDPADALWREPLAAQIDRALAALALPPGNRPAGADLVFADVTVLGPVPGTAGDRLEARCGDLVVDLLVAHDHPALAYRDNLRLLASVPGLRLRVAGRLEPAARPALRALAAGLPPGAEDVPGQVLALPADRAGRVDLGLDRLTRADLPAAPDRPPAQGPEAGGPGAGGPEAGPGGFAAGADDARTPLHHLERQVRRAVTGGRRVVAARGGGDAATALRAEGLPTGAALAAALAAAAADRGRDAFGRLLPADTDRFAALWLAAALYARSATAEMTRGAWTLT